MVHLAAVSAEVTAVQTARLYKFVDMVFEHHGMQLDIVSDRDPRFTARFWQEVLTLLGSQLSMSTADHPQSDGQTERVNRVLGDLLKSYAHSFQQWSDCLPMAEFAITNSMHASTGHTPFYVNAKQHPNFPSMIGTVASSFNGGGSTVAPEQPQKSADTDTVSAMTTRRQAASRSRIKTTNKNYGSVQGTDSATKDNTSMQGTDTTQAGPVAGTKAVLNKPFSTQVMDFVQRRQAVIRFVQDAIAASLDRQQLNADNVGRGNTNEFEKGSLVLLATQNLPRHVVSDFGGSTLAPRFIGPFTILERYGNAYTLDIPSSMWLHPTLYVGRLKPYTQHEPSTPNCVHK
ncbi:hypothetical protein PC129_g22513 [Phytophthora cactorum]|uniref:Integrase catalytic domain-containing protein n=1 Tax=Phytophthora cactorum TaxID=29920 RepID=A0A8T0ZM14_9STRA|nr:hypothetical protein Pcac1_g16020 [Phytophthora cactorum]KAG2817895.1 hypothetical protein PC111_g12524 [Phytophthora cactorum]KAG2864112.1 hypothetical protein PC113_g4868 [Phytophthora cactorum]KAG2897502.1 hypothetical protein PC114_g14650 [Phytophthora cactorum]KAG2924355.1 hypothetical protein PC115_g8641 [Phytophthora cactorum]